MYVCVEVFNTAGCVSLFAAVFHHSMAAGANSFVVRCQLLAKLHLDTHDLLAVTVGGSQLDDVRSLGKDSNTVSKSVLMLYK